MVLRQLSGFGYNVTKLEKKSLTFTDLLSIYINVHGAVQASCIYLHVIRGLEDTTFFRV